MASLSPIRVPESPRSIAKDKDSEVGKVEGNMRTWCRELALAVRTLEKRIQDLETRITNLEK